MISFIFYRFKKTSLLTNKSGQQNFALSPLLLPFPLRHYRAKNHRASPPSSSRDDFRPGLSCFNTCSAQKSAPRSGDKPDLGAIILESRFFDPLSCKYSPLATPPDSNSFLPSRPQPFRECRFQIAIILGSLLRPDASAAEIRDSLCSAEKLDFPFRDYRLSGCNWILISDISGNDFMIDHFEFPVRQ